MAGFLRHANRNSVRNDARAGGNGGPIASGFANDGRTFPRDRSFIYRGDAFDHFTVGRDEIARIDDDHIIPPEHGSGHNLPVRKLCVEFRFGGTQRCGLSAPPPFRQCLGKRAEQHGQPQPANQLQLKPKSEFPAAERQQYREQQGDNRRSEKHGIFNKFAWVQLLEGVADRREDEVGREDGSGGAHRTIPF